MARPSAAGSDCCSRWSRRRPPPRSRGMLRAPGARRRRRPLGRPRATSRPQPPSLPKKCGRRTCLRRTGAR
eukprot:10354420-Alexandrium_andersonii.AAC.1